MTLRLSIPELQRIGLTVPTIEALLALQDIYDEIPPTLTNIGTALAASANQRLDDAGIGDEVFIYTVVDYTTTGDEAVVIAGSNITVTLNDSPADGERVSVKRSTTAGYVVVSGNGNTVDGDTTFTMVVNYDSYTFVYSEEAGEWVIV